MLQEEEAAPAVTGAETAVVEESSSNNDTTATVKKRRGMTGYMFYLQTHRESIKAELGEGGRGVKDVTRIAAERWRAMREEERKQWNEDGKLAPVAEKAPTTSAAAAATDAVATTKVSNIPLSKVREICKTDAEVRAINGEAVSLLASATEMFLNDLLATSLSKSANKKQVKLVDVHHAIHVNDEKFGFLVMDFEPPAQIEAQEYELNKRKRESNKLARKQQQQQQQQQQQEEEENEEEGEAGKTAAHNPITSYFTSSSTSKRSKQEQAVVDEE